MGIYVSTKIVSVVSADVGEAVKIGQVDGTKAVNMSEEERNGWLVTTEQGAKYWLTDRVFKATHRPIAQMTFGHAVELLKAGMKVCRQGWNGKGMHLSYVNPYNNKQFDLVEKEIEGTFADYIGMKTVDNKFVPWLASQTDVLAEDWMLIEKQS